jgi:hypothetical protein
MKHSQHELEEGGNPGLAVTCAELATTTLADLAGFHAYCVTAEARSSHWLRVRLSLEGCTALEGIARRRMAGACAVSLFLCPKRVEALRLGVERASYDWTGRPSSNLLLVCVVRCAVFFTGSSWATACRCIAPRISAPPPGWL